ncbi:MAG: DUF4367 domain-containing protein [Firmicutes bacterium]|nr:DUF4367 domain-containing protein [Bacillota bacterium]
MNKKDKGLGLLAELIAEDMDKEIEEIEQLDVEVPEELHRQMLEFVRELDRKDAERRRRQFRTRAMRFAAVFCVCIVTMGTLAIGNSEALRERVFTLFHNEEYGSVTLRTESEYDMIGSWDDYWYPTWIPDGYYLLGADKEVGVMLFVSDTEEAEIRIIESSLNHTQSYDEDTSDFKKIEVKGYNGYLFNDVANCSIDLIWFTDSRIMEIKVKNLKNEDIVMKIAQNMKYMPKR